jgi:hypothetical protein
MDGVPSTVPLSAKVLAEYGRPVDGAANDLVRLIRAGEATPLHWNRLLHFLDSTLETQIVGYAMGMNRFPSAPAAWPFLDFATYKLNAREYLRTASAKIEEVHPGAAAVGSPPLSAHHYGWCFLWLGSVPPMATAGLAMYAGLLDWHRFCVELLLALEASTPAPPEELRRVFRRFEQRPASLDRCLVLAEEGLARGDDPACGIAAMDVALDTLAAFLRDCSV